MPGITLEITCPNCETELDIEAEITVTHDHHPYGSTFATEESAEVEIFDATCTDCGHDCNDEAEKAASEMELYDLD